MICGDETACVALVVSDVEAAAAVWQNDFDLTRSECAATGGPGKTPLLHVGTSVLAFSPGNPALGMLSSTGVDHIALAAGGLDAAVRGTDAALAWLHLSKIQLIDRQAGPSARRSGIGFINPKSVHGGLVHLVVRG
jgi:hypothetical protein